MRRIESRAVSWLVVVTAMLSLVSMSFAAQNGANTVNSAAIIAADGTSGQTLTTGNGVKTGHIQDGAVTASKLGVVCPTGNYLQFVEGSGWVCSVGTAGPAGPQGPVGATPHYANNIVVAKSGGDFTDPVSALNSIVDASAENPYLIKIMPGVYDIASNFLNLKSFVVIEGSGENNTIIKGAPSNSGYGPSSSVLVVGGGENIQISNLTLHNYGGIGPLVYSHGIWVSVSNFKLFNTTIITEGGLGNSAITLSGTANVQNVTFIFPSPSWFDAGLDIRNFDSIVTLKNANLNNSVVRNQGNLTLIDVLVNGMVSSTSTGGTLTIRNSTILGVESFLNGKIDIAFSEVGTVYTNGPGGKIANTKVSGNISGIQLSCYNIYNDVFAPVTCP